MVRNLVQGVDLVFITTKTPRSQSVYEVQARSYVLGAVFIWALSFRFSLGHFFLNVIQPAEFSNALDVHTHCVLSLLHVFLVVQLFCLG